MSARSPIPRMEGKTCLVTGANSGVGKVTAVELARAGAEVGIVCRDAARGEAAVAEIRQRSGNQRVSLLTAELSSQEAVRRVADEVSSRYARLDVLVNNAGAIFGERRLSKDGIEMTFALNHLGYFLLANLLVDLLQRSAPARIVNVASEAHRSASLNFDDLQNAKSYSSFPVYGQSKLANIVFTYEHARRLQGTGVTANCLHPGVVATHFGKSGSFLLRVVLALARPFLVSPEKGAETQIYLASSPDVEGVSGQYFDKKRAVKSNAESYDETAGRRLWDVSASMTGLST